jgi:hypothetical protein
VGEVAPGLQPVPVLPAGSTPTQAVESLLSWVGGLFVALAIRGARVLVGVCASQ